jgi:hypothetical protein
MVPAEAKGNLSNRQFLLQTGTNESRLFAAGDAFPPWRSYFVRAGSPRTNAEPQINGLPPVTATVAPEI